MSFCYSVHSAGRNCGNGLRLRPSKVDTGPQAKQDGIGIVAPERLDELQVGRDLAPSRDADVVIRFSGWLVSQRSQRPGAFPEPIDYAEIGIAGAERIARRGGCVSAEIVGNLIASARMRVSPLAACE